MNAVVEHKEPELPAPVARLGITETQWRTMKNLYPGAKGDSILMVWHYCRARQLDPLKKPCHIVPMEVKGEWQDVVMPGIYEYRTTAMRTGLYMGHSEPVHGPEIEFKGVKAPEWCSITIYRWSTAAGIRTEFPVKVYFSECVGLAWDKQAREHKVNARWTKAPRQMLTKCTEAAGLREAFPDELGGEHTAEEMEGQLATVRVVETRVERPAPPEGYENWRADMDAKADEGKDAHTAAYEATKEEFRLYASKHDLEWWEASKARAARILR